LTTPLLKIFFADEFRKFGSNEAVRQALSRLCKKQFLIRLSAGIVQGLR
jgi:NDP-sugar pyrophosphorylase family protein